MKKKTKLSTELEREVKYNKICLQLKQLPQPHSHHNSVTGSPFEPTQSLPKSTYAPHILPHIPPASCAQVLSVLYQLTEGLDLATTLGLQHGLYFGLNIAQKGYICGFVKRSNLRILKILCGTWSCQCKEIGKGSQRTMPRPSQYLQTTLFK